MTMVRHCLFHLLTGTLAICSTAVAQEDIHTVIQKGHSGKITAIDFSKDGKFFVTGSTDHSVKLWDLKTGREVRTFKGHRGEITDVRIDSRNGFIVSSAGAKGEAELRVWDVKSGVSQNEIEGGKSLSMLGVLFGKIDFEWAFQLRSFDLRQDGTLIWAEDNHGVKVGKISKSKYDRILPTNWEPTVVRYSPDGNLIAAGGQSFNRVVGKESNEVVIWNSAKTMEKLSLQTKLSDITTLSFDRSGKFLAVLSHSTDTTITKAINSIAETTFLNVVEVFEIGSQRKLFETSWIGLKSNVLSLSPDGKVLATSHRRADERTEELIIYNIEAKSELKRFDSREMEIYSMGFSPDGRLLIANGEQIHFWKVGSWTHLREIFRADKIDDFELVNNTIHTYRYMETNATMNTMDLESGGYESLVMEPVQKVKHHKNLVYVSRGCKLEQYDPSGKTVLKTLVDKIEGWDEISDFFIDSESSYLVCINTSQKNIFVRPLKKMEPGFFLSGHQKGIKTIAFSGTRMASAGDDNRIILWNIASKSKEVELLGHNNGVNALDFNSDGTMLASGSSDNNIKLWDIKKMEQIETLRGHKEDVLSIRFSEKGDLLASSSGSLSYEGESEIMMWDVRRKKSIWKVPGNEGYTRKIVFSGNRIYSIGNDAVIKMLDIEKGDQKFFYTPLTNSDFVISTHDNYYLSTKASLQFVHFVKGNSVYAFDNFDLKYNRPDLVLSNLGSKNRELIDAYYKIYLRRLKRNGFTKEEIDKETHVPSAAILNLDSISYLSSTDNTRLLMEFKDDKFRLKYYNVWVNSVPIFGAKGVAITGNDVGKIKTSLSLPLNEGYNRIEIGCVNDKGAKSPREMTEVFWASQRKPNLYMVNVCASNYANASLNLTYSVKDGQDMVNLFKRNQEFDKINVYTLYNDEVTKPNFASIKQKLMDSKPDDEVILFMAGHGILDKNFDFNFVTYDMDLDRVGETSISFENIENFIDSIPARKKMVLIDACHSGGIDKEEIEEKAIELTSRSGKNVKIQNMDNIRQNVFSAYYGVDNTFVKLMEEMFYSLGEGSGAYVISAASVNGYAFESGQWNNGVFTYSILEGLSSGLADVNNDGLVKVSELKNFLIENVIRLTDNQQRPTCRKENQDLDFVVWRN